MVQCALALGPFLETLVKDEPDGTCSLDVAALDAARVSAIVALRCVLDITTFQRAPKVGFRNFVIRQNRSEISAKFQFQIN